MVITLRPYQQEAIDKTYEFWERGWGSHPLIVAPTGAGKSLIIGQLVKDICGHDGRVLILAHVKELIEQNAKELHALMPSADIGVYSAGLGKKQLHRQVTFAGIQSVWKRAFDMVPAPDVILIDEAHMLPKKTTTRYGAFIKDMMVCNPRAKIVGLTATPYRLDSGMLHKGDSAIFDGISYDISVADLMRDGYLAPLITKGGASKIDLSNVHKRGGEYIESELAAAASDPALVEAVVAEIIALGKGRRSWLVFASGVGHAEMLRDEFTDNSIDAAVITGDTPKALRERLIQEFKDGDLRCLINVNVLTTGFNAPGTDLVALVRATMSTSLYVQMVGRGTRTAPGKDNCLVLDYGNNVIEHGPFDKVKPRDPSGGGGGEAPAKECPQCSELLPTAVRECPGCGHEFPPPQLNHNSNAYGGAIMSDQVEAEWLRVDDVTYMRHQKSGKPDSLKVTYHCGLTRVNEWLCPDHGGRATANYRARKGLLLSGADTVDECLQEAHWWNKPKRIKVRPDGKYFELVQLDYVGEPDAEGTETTTGTRGASGVRELVSGQVPSSADILDSEWW